MLSFDHLLNMNNPCISSDKFQFGQCLLMCIPIILLPHFYVDLEIKLITLCVQVARIVNIVDKMHHGGYTTVYETHSEDAVILAVGEFFKQTIHVL